MIPTTTIGAAPPPGGGGTEALAAQNLFEHMAQQSGVTLQATTPAELGSSILNSLEGPLDKVQNFSNRLQDSDVLRSSGGEGVAGERAVGVEDMQFDRMLESFSTMFDHATLTKLMSSCASQMSGACQTLLRGQ
ncbi:hypothetical protein EI168_01440 [Halomonas sp. FME1]|uniref:Uncharacterized protein n=1 Tax=Halomonas casei TaxID=2742613 RepID=A0ABR9EX33_9GAMM|nr:hypothetical protein [Halomonas casei]MBE0398773.1 hypothetical protein [Halomonas casei]